MSTETNPQDIIEKLKRICVYLRDKHGRTETEPERRILTAAHRAIQRETEGI